MSSQLAVARLPDQKSKQKIQEPKRPEADELTNPRSGEYQNKLGLAFNCRLHRCTSTLKLRRTGHFYAEASKYGTRIFISTRSKG